MATHSSILAWRIATDRGAYCSLWGHKESDKTERLSPTHSMLLLHTNLKLRYLPCWLELAHHYDVAFNLISIFLLKNLSCLTPFQLFLNLGFSWHVIFCTLTFNPSVFLCFIRLADNYSDVMVWVTTEKGISNLYSRGSNEMTTCSNKSLKHAILFKGHCASLASKCQLRKREGEFWQPVGTEL